MAASSSAYGMMTEVTPLLWTDVRRSRSEDRLPYYRQDEQHAPLVHKDAAGNDPHAQFCALTGCPPSNLPKDKRYPIPKKSLYGRTVSQLSSQRRAYNASAVLNNFMLLAQVVLGAALTGLGASASSHVLITIFGAMNTIIAGLVAYLKSRGQPMRARMYRDDLERVVDEIENSEVMWRGISEGAHGYDEIDTDDVTVRSEVARLTRLYERAIRLNGMNNPDMYMAGAGGFDGNVNGGVRPSRSAANIPAGAESVALPAVVASTAPQPSAENSGTAVPLVQSADDAAPATKAAVKESKLSDTPKEETKPESKGEGNKTSNNVAFDDNAKAAPQSSSKPANQTSTPPPAQSANAQTQPQSQPPPPPSDPDASPATAARFKPKRTKSDKPREAGADTKKVSGDDEE